MFLPDRFVKGTCPRCGTPDQYGDNCEVCGATYSPTELIDPVSVVSGTRPVAATSEHYFFELGDFERLPARVGLDRVGCSPRSSTSSTSGSPSRCATGTSRATRPTSASRSRTRRASTSTSGSTRRSATWRASRRCATTATARLRRLLGAGLDGRDPPLHRQGHRLLPQPVLAGDAARRRLPRCRRTVHVHGYLTVNGEKMSKSRGTFITARALPRPPRPRAPALLLRGASSARASTTSTSTSRTTSTG